MEYNFDPHDRLNPTLEGKVVAPNAGENFRKARERERERRAKELQNRQAPNNAPERAPLSEVGKQALDNLKRYGGRPDLILKENPHRVRKPRRDPGKKTPPKTP